MKPAGGGIPRLAPLLLASLLLHLAVIGILFDRFRRPHPTLLLPMTVVYVEIGTQRVLGVQNRTLPALPASGAQRGASPEAGPVAPRPVIQPLPIGETPRMAGPAQLVAAPALGNPRAPQMPDGGTASPRDMVSGAGNGSNSGQSGDRGNRAAPPPERIAGTAGSPSGSTARQAAYQAQLKRLIEARKEYPLAARKAGHQGVCQRSFVISRNGSLKNVKAVSSCGYVFLDEAATRAITAVGTFPPLPDDFKGAEETFTVSMSFMLAR